MKKIILAKTAGFCFGVNRAVEMIYDLLKDGKKVCTLGPIIHNDQMVNDLKKSGVRIIESPTEVEPGEIMVIRSHGVPLSVFDDSVKCGVEIADATCPFVAKIHSIVRKESENGSTILIAGDKDHSEVKGITGHCSGKYFVFASDTELESLLKQHQNLLSEPVSVVSQTTFNEDLWIKCQNHLKKYCTNLKIFDTICNATANRQQEAKELSSVCDVMIVIGGKHSSNTAKLREVCEQHCRRTYFVETADELRDADFTDANTFGVVAGASTPGGIIKEVLKTMDEIVTSTENEETSFEEMLEQSLSGLNTDQKVKGTVLAVNPTEIQVDIGRKQTGYIKAEEFSYDSSVKLTDAVKVGDVLDLIVLKTNDQEGTIMLSKRRFDAYAGWDKIVAAKESGDIIEAKVTDVIKGGVVAFYEGIRVFLPASHVLKSKEDSLNDLKGQNIKFKIIEIGPRRRVIGSARSVLREERKAAEAKFWENVAVGDRITGTVKSITGYGAFVDIGGVDGMVHISELSWERIKHPSEVVSVGDQIEVYVKSIDTEKRKVSLGYKKAEDNPWEIFKNKFAVGDVVNVTIVSMTDYGAFARIIKGVDGLIHVSQIDQNRVEKPQDKLEIGQKVDVKITAIDFDKKRISLSIKALTEPEEAPAEETAEPEKEAE